MPTFSESSSASIAPFVPPAFHEEFDGLQQALTKLREERKKEREEPEEEKKMLIQILKTLPLEERIQHANKIWQFWSSINDERSEAEDGLERTGSIIAAKRSKEEEASKVVMAAEQVCVLPFDMVGDILSRLPAKSLIRFRCACKKWCSLTYDPAFVKKQYKRALDRPAFVSQGFILDRVSLHHFGDDSEIKRSSFYSELGKPQFLSNPINGLVCVSPSLNRPPYGDDGRFYLLNPSTREVAELPRSASIERNVNVGLGFDVSTGEYKVVRIREGSTCWCRGIEVLSVGTREWRYVGDAPCNVLPWSPIFLNGAFHWTVLRLDIFPFAMGILVFDLKDEKIRVMPTPESGHFYSTWFMGLMAHRGRLCFVRHAQPFYNDPGHFFIIWSLRDYTSHEWVKEYDIDISNFATMFHQFSIIAMRGHKIIFKACCRKKASLQKVYSYDICCGTAQELYRGNMGSHGLLAESLVSPRNLVGNLPL